MGIKRSRVRKDYVEKVIESRFMRRANKCRRSKYAQRLCCDQPKRRSLRYVLSAITFALCCSTVPAQQPRASEYQVKAAYLYKFGGFVKWPPSTAADKNESFTVCVLGADPFGATLDSTLAGETLDGKPVVIKRISKPQDATGCRILFISSTEEEPPEGDPSGDRSNERLNGQRHAWFFAARRHDRVRPGRRAGFVSRSTWRALKTPN